MDLGRATLLGPGAVCGLWSPARTSSTLSKPLRDTQQLPTSLQVFHACVYEGLRQRSEVQGLGLVAAEERFHRENQQSHHGKSMRQYAWNHLEHERKVYDTIEGCMDVDRLMWEAQLAFMAHKPTLAVLLWHRASVLGANEACMHLAQLLGLGIVRGGVVRFERDSLRGLAWATRAAQTCLESESFADDTRRLQLLRKALFLMCTLVCTPEALQELFSERPVSSSTVPSLYTLPRSCLPLHASLRNTNGATGPVAKPLWTELYDVVEAASRRDMTLTIQEPEEDFAHETDVYQIRLSVKFLTAIGSMHRAVSEKDLFAAREAYQTWSDYLSQSLACESTMQLEPYRCVATEAQQWCALSADGNTNVAFSGTELAHLRDRIARTFAFAPRKSLRTKQKSTVSTENRTNRSVNAASQNANFLQVPVPSRRMGMPSRRPSRPRLLTNVTSPSVSFTPTADHAMSHVSQQFSGTTSTKLRSVPGVPIQQVMSPSSVPSSPLPSEDFGSYLEQLNDPTPTRRRRPSSVVSVTPSLMFPSKKSSDAEPAMTESSFGFVHGELAQATCLTQPSDFQDQSKLRSRLQRQSSRASLRT